VEGESGVRRSALMVWLVCELRMDDQVSESQYGRRDRSRLYAHTVIGRWVDHLCDTEGVGTLIGA
jgi:hypothetical protein